MATDEYLSLGKISGAHGVYGKLRIRPYADDLTTINIGTCLFIRRQADRQLKPITVTGWRPHSHVILLSCKEITSRGQAEAEKGGEVVIVRSELPDPGEDAYYWVDIIGLPVYTMENDLIGHVKSIMPTGSNDVYIVYNTETSEEVLIPAIKAVVKDIDLDAGVIRVDLTDLAD